MKGDIYYLKETTGDRYIVGRFVVESDDYHLIGTCYGCSGWYSDGSIDDHYFTDVYCKKDTCTHWNFYGEDYDPETESEKDSYYHICGTYCFNDHIRLMCFVWKLAGMINNSPDYMHDNELTKKLVDMMLEGYEIVKGE